MSPKHGNDAPTAPCPDCGEKITLRGSIHVGREVVCPNCDAELEVIETEPLAFDWVVEDYEEYYDEEEVEEEDW